MMFTSHMPHQANHGFQGPNINCLLKISSIHLFTNVISVKHCPRTSGKDKGAEHLISSLGELSLFGGGGLGGYRATDRI